MKFRKSGPCVCWEICESLGISLGEYSTIILSVNWYNINIYVTWKFHATMTHQTRINRLSTVYSVLITVNLNL